MSSIKIKWQAANMATDTYDMCRSELADIISVVKSVRVNRCMRGGNFNEIYASLDRVISDIENQKTNIQNLRNSLTEVLRAYDTYENRISGQINGDTLKEVNVETSGGNLSDLYLQLEKILGSTISKSSIIPSLLPLISPVIDLLDLNSGVPFSGNTVSDKSGKASASAEWLGYEFDDDHPKVTAWVGKANAEASNEWGYAGVNAYVGKVQAEAKTDASLMKYKSKQEYKDGEWTEKEVLSFLNAEASAGASVSVLAGDAKAGIGNDMLGAEVKAEGSVGNAKAKAEGKFSVGEDGVTAVASGEAMVSAVEGKASGTINILGLEIKGTVGGYAGAAGVKGKIGIEDNKFVMEGGVAAVLGISGGVEIGFNSEGWSNFVDFITFWD